MGFDKNLVVMDLGGSVVAPQKPDIPFLKEFMAFIRQWLDGDKARRMIIVVGGGGVARDWQSAARELSPHASNDMLDWVGVMATRLNAELMRCMLGDFCPAPVVTNPEMEIDFCGRILMAAGWKPGFSTDYDAVKLAERFGAEYILMLSNIDHVYDGDPQRNPNARPLEQMTWEQYNAMIDHKWSPGANMPFDPVAAAQAAKLGLTLIAAAGRDIDNQKAILEGRPFRGTRIVPQ